MLAVHSGQVQPRLDGDSSELVDSFSPQAYTVQEKSEARVEFQDSRPDVMTRVLEFLYTGEYSVDVPQPLQTTALPSDTASIEAVSPADPSHKDAEDMDRRMDNLKTHTLVYQLADMLGIKNLKDSVADSFRAIFDYDVITHSKFGELLDSVFTNTPRNDNNLRSRVMIHCVIRNDLIKHGGIPEGILKTHEPLAWLTGVAMQRHHEKSRAKMNALDVTVAELRGSRESQAS